MGKDIIIQESGEPKTLSSIDKIITPKVGGGSAEWVLFENLDLMAKTITKNGTYKAEDDNVYGYHKVTVKVPKKGKKKTGKRPQSSGDPNDYCVTTEDDGQGGQNLVYTKLPTSINIINPPSKTVYDDNELIKKQGMLVKAYYADGGLWGDVPLGEIRLDPDRADASQAPDTDDWDVSGLGFNSPVYFVPAVVGQDMNGLTVDEIIADSTVYGVIYEDYVGRFIMSWVSKSPFNIKQSRGWDGGSYPENRLGTKSTVDGKTAYVWSVVVWRGFDPGYAISAKQTSENFNLVTAINDGHAKKGQQVITVKWNRPEDEKELTDTFEITVTSANTSGESQGGNTSENNTGGGGGSW